MESERLKQSQAKKKFLNRLFLGTMIFLEVLVLITLAMVGAKAALLFTASLNTSVASDFYRLLAIGLLVLWFGIIIAYYAWAIYFYNINLGLTDMEWEEVRERYGYIPSKAEDVRDKNPHADQTLGLPPGTLRGTIALTLLIGGLSMAIASMGMDTTLKANSFIVDHFDFFKTAFLMMIAFYFGNKALETIGYKSSKVLGAPGSQQNSNIADGANAGGSTSAGADVFTAETTPAPPPAATSEASVAKSLLRNGDAELSADPNIGVENDQKDFENPQAAQ